MSLLCKLPPTVGGKPLKNTVHWGSFQNQENILMIGCTVTALLQIGVKRKPWIPKAFILERRQPDLNFVRLKKTSIYKEEQPLSPLVNPVVNLFLTELYPFNPVYFRLLRWSPPARE